MRHLFYLALFIISSFYSSAQDTFNYSIHLEEVEIDGFPGIHSYAYGQIDDVIIILGGRRDGIHARHPFAAFPRAFSNDDIILLDLKNKSWQSKALESLPTNIAEQLSATNINFHQDGDNLILIGGYGYSASRNDHLTYPYLTVVDLRGLKEAILTDKNINPYFRQVTDVRFAVTGGHLGKLEKTFLLIGGHRFDGRYNPMGGPSFTQAYTNQIRKFQIDMSSAPLEWTEIDPIIDPIHLHRRDYNLVPMIYENNQNGYLISSGVFQLTADLPFLYPVEIFPDSIAPQTSFNQYLSNYHGAMVSLHESSSGSMHIFFFGGISQFYFEGDSLIQDNLVPFVSTISRVTRTSEGAYEEFKLDKEMPGLLAASAEFVINPDVPQTPHGVISLDAFQDRDSILLGHIVGGINSPERNPFSNNRTQVTRADHSIRAVYLVKEIINQYKEVDGYHDITLQIFPNPTSSQIKIKYQLYKDSRVEYLITNTLGKIVQAGDLYGDKGENIYDIPLNFDAPGIYFFTLIVDHRYYVSKRVVKQ